MTVVVRPDEREKIRAEMRALAEHADVTALGRSEWLAAASLPDDILDVAIVQGAERCGWAARELLDLAASMAPVRRRGLGRKTIALRDAIVRELEALPELVSTRQVYYRIVSSGHVPNSEKSYRCVAQLLVDMRADGSIPYARIVDRGRTHKQRAAWSSSVELLEACTEQLYLDRWAEQPTVPHIALEKRALEGVFEEACEEYGAPLYPFGGYASVSFLYEWAEHIKDANRRGQNVAVYYFGDHDPDGIDIERAAQDALTKHGARFDWLRHGLLRSDLDQSGMVILPIKATSPRAKSYTHRFGDIGGAELDALDPAELLLRVRRAIVPHIDDDAWERIAREERLQREGLALVAGNWAAALAGARSAA